MRQPAALTFLALAALLLAGGSAHAQESAPTVDFGDIRKGDKLAQDALRASLLGDSERVALLARMRGREEELHGVRKGRGLSENVAALAAATARPLLDGPETRALVEGFRPDRETRNIARLLARIEPRERFREARADRRYEQRRRVYNSLLTAATGVLQLQFFSLLQPPLDAAEHLLVGRRYLSPEQRRELYRAREVEALPPGRRDPAAIAVGGAWPPRRLALARLQARRNAARATSQGRLETAEWWHQRESVLAAGRAGSLPRHPDLQDAIVDRERDRRAAVVVTAGESALREPAHFARYGELLRAFVADSASPRVPELVQAFRIDFPLSEALDEVALAEALHARDSGQVRLARVNFEYLARGTSAWSRKAARYLGRADFTPSVAFREAEAAIARRKREFLLFGRNPAQLGRTLSPEQARALEAGWITTARSLFVIDVVGRLIALPLLPASFFPRDELFTAAATAYPSYLETDEGRAWLRRTAGAYTAAKRHADAASLFDRLGDPAAAAESRERAAAALERDADALPGWPERAEAYRRIASAYPRYTGFDRVRGKQEHAERRLGLQAVLSRAELEAYPHLWREGGLFLSPVLFDGVRENGELAEGGVTLLAPDRIAYRDLAVSRPIEIAVEPGTNDYVLQLLAPIRRSSAVGEELSRAPARKRIPLAIEGSALPGLDLAPGLVPLDLDPKEKRLYQ
jgi:hypothetical protein